MKISIVTVCYNSAATIRKTIDSVRGQTYPNIEYIIVDGASTDSTLDIVRECHGRVSTIITEPDNGIYDAMNKGIYYATGEVVAFLNSDDIYSDSHVLSEVAAAFKDGAEYVYGDILMVGKDGRVIREWNTGPIVDGVLRSMQIPHPAFFVKTNILRNMKPAFDTSYKISADLKQQLIVVNKLKSRGHYLHRSLVRMSIGGASTGSVNSYFAGWVESRRAYNDVFGGGGFFYTVRKIASKFSGIRTINLFGDH